jgi:hypothetical protein
VESRWGKRKRSIDSPILAIQIINIISFYLIKYVETGGGRWAEGKGRVPSLGNTTLCVAVSSTTPKVKIVSREVKESK